MKIISKHKDYYDYHQGIFGIDNTRVYNRNNLTRFRDCSFIREEGIHSILFAVCGFVYTVYIYKGKFYHTIKDLMMLDKLTYLKSRSRWYRDKTTRKERAEEKYKKNNMIPTGKNILFREPVLIKHKSYGDWEMEVPLLSDFDFHKVLDAKDIYIKVETFLGWLKDNPEIPNNQSNKEKIVSHGFDLKKSFRHRN